MNDNDDNEPTILMGIRLDARSWVEIARDKPPVDIKTDLAAIEGKILHAPPLVMSEEQHRRWGYILGSDEMDRGAGD